MDELKEVLKGTTCLLLGGLLLKQAKKEDGLIEEAEKEGNKKLATGFKVAKGILLGSAAFDVALGIKTLTTVNVFLIGDK